MAAAASGKDKLPFDLEEVLRRVREAVEPFPKAAMFELFDRGHRTAFEQLVACVLSVRTRIDAIIAPVTFH